jgi:hypothetical protein
MFMSEKNIISSDDVYFIDALIYNDGIDFRRELGILLFTAASGTALVPTQPPIQWVSRGSFPGGKAVGA